MEHSNPYIQQLLEKGYSISEAQAIPASKKTFPCTIGLRYFETEEEYNDALNDYLNGN